MPGKRKRSRAREAAGGDQKRQMTFGSEPGQGPTVQHAVLAQYYSQVITLREYLVSKLPTSSKIRRRKIKTIGLKPLRKDLDEEKKLSNFLDQTLVGACREVLVSSTERWQQWTTVSQKADESASTLANLSGSTPYSQSEIVDFVIWLLFSKPGISNNKNSHLLCQGYRRDTARSIAQTGGAVSTISGVSSTYPNFHVTSMKSSPWPQILTLLGKEGERAMIDLILECGVFIKIPSGQGTYNQLSGRPLGELKALPLKKECSRQQKLGAIAIRYPSEIAFVRHRLLYGRAAINAQGEIRFGLRAIHALNRHALKASTDAVLDEDEDRRPAETCRSTVNIIIYMFPRQFGLHNVFTSEVDTNLTVQQFQDYTVREDEISIRFPAPATPKIPKRLRGKLVGLIRKLQVQHTRCSYKQLLEYYCPVSVNLTYMPDSNPVSGPNDNSKRNTQNSVVLSSAVRVAPEETNPSTRNQSMMDYATPTRMVSAFCKAVVSHVIPDELWGTGDIQAHNLRIFFQNVDRFVELRRFESLSLHEVSQGIKIGSIEWLGPAARPENKLSQSSFHKRWEIFFEFLYYLFDSLLIPLIRTNFHVTESNVNRYRLFYFRYDVWKTLTEPVFTTLKHSMFEELKLQNALNILHLRPLSYSRVRLLPKQSGIRPIMNLRRRSMKQGFLGPSINSILAPIYNVLTYEKNSDRDRLGSALFSVGDLYTRLKQFKSRSSTAPTPLFFAKLDIKSAFDTIPQAAVIDLVRSIPSETEFRISKHTEIRPGDNYRSDTTSKPIRKYKSLAHSLDDFESFDEKLESELAPVRKNVIFVENVVNQFRDTDELMDLLSEHVKNNMVKIGKKYYRQKEGIPQGSVLSSLLCNYFYADLEARHLKFLEPDESLLLRLIDDFLLITPNRSHAKRFLQVMHDGIPQYGVRVNPDKTLVNFEVQVNGKKVSRLLGQKQFPYCGSLIDTQTLDIRRDRDRTKDLAISDSLTVEFAKVPGKTFHRKVLNTFKIQSHAMFLDTSYNSMRTVISNIHTAFIESAAKMWAYVKCMPGRKQPGTRLLIKTIQDLTELAFVLMKSKGKTRRNPGFTCAVSKRQVEWLALDAFQTILEKKQSRFLVVLEWLSMKMNLLETKDGEMVHRLARVVSAR